MKYIYCLLVISCISAPHLSFTQTKAGAPHLGIGWTGLLYKGDLTVNETDYLRIYPGSNIFLQFANQRAFRLRFGAGFGKIVEQSDLRSQTFAEERQTNDYFETSLFYLDLRLMRYFFRKGPVQPYLGFGPSIMFFNPKDQNGNFLIDNIFTREVGEDFATTIFVWPATAGLSFPLSKVLRINADYTYRLNMSDYIDNIGLLGNDPGRDQLHAFQVSFDVRLGVNRKPKEKAPMLKEVPPLKPIVLTKAPSKEEFSLRYRKIEADHHDKIDRINALEMDYLRYYEMPEKSRLYQQEVYMGDLALRRDQKLEDQYRAKLKAYIWKHELFKQVGSKGRLSCAALAESHSLSLEDFRELNPSLPDPIPNGHELKVPDWEAAAKAMEK